MTHLDEKALEQGASVEAKWDGRSFEGLGAADKKRYVERFADGVTAYLSSLPSSPVSELVERLEKRAKEDEECAENNRVVADLLSPELAKFNGRDEAGWNTYAVRTAVDHRKSMERDSRYSTDLREAASALTALSTLSTRNAELEREVKRLRDVTPREPTGEMMDAVRHIVQWLQEPTRPTEAGLFSRCAALRKPAPERCREGIDHVPPARLIAYWIWTAMHDAALSTSPQGGERA